ncbi:ATP-dependent RecD-like DNA helicase [Engelhardtia mirabilis]|uniref:ATP-dependent RecD-like DNA helicase n=1 Tax=Engelhardtia mirabilis TaxID=2528011 RepID=A0A518BSD6_9BACT|nr:ATP-dependent RecD-like DNA helicase [Planctomycetes bacterium Pla133]QDV04209.1 ATP-dependent RecD-like DNA helicase [Planctomycetes bacterium Pla86]
MDEPANDLPTVLEGAVDRVTFHSEESLYTVLRVRAEGALPAELKSGSLVFDPVVTAVGRCPRPSEGLGVRLGGIWTRHKTHGLQFEFDRLELRAPTDRKGLVRYLASDRFEGVGEVLAGRIVDALGNDALEQIRADRSCLDAIKGLAPPVAENLHQALVVEKGSHALYTFLLGIGLGPWQVEAVIEKYGQQAEARLRHNPYLLSSGIAGIGFQTADRVARELGLPEDGLERRRAAILHVLEKASGQGHCCLPLERLAEAARELLGQQFDDAAFVEAVEGLRRMDDLVIDEAATGEPTSADGAGTGDKRAWLPGFFAAEVGLAERLAGLVAAGPARAWATEADLARKEQQLGITLHTRQREAVLGLLSAPVGLLTGGPGVGKTTIVRAVVDLARAAGARVLLASPTGRAAKRLAEATGEEASTVHRLLGFEPGTRRFLHDDEKPLEADLLVVDEISMLDLSLAYSLVRAVRAPTRVILVGDPDQLPSVAAGNVLSDLLAAGCLPVFRLTQIFRQAAHSLIVDNAHAILEGHMPRFPGADEPLSDFYFFPTEGEQATADRLVEVVTRRIPEKFGLDWLEDVQVLAPMYRGECGVDRLNERLREQVTGSRREGRLRGRVWREGDRVIHTRNDYEKEVFNGDMGRVVRINADGTGLSVRYPERVVFYEPEHLGDLQPAFAITVHRSQGGEFPGVVMPLVPQHYLMLQRHLLYTAVTRAKRLCVLVGSRRALEMAVQNAEQKLRLSGLEGRLRRACGDQTAS